MNHFSFKFISLWNFFLLFFQLWFITLVWSWKLSLIRNRKKSFSVKQNYSLSEYIDENVEIFCDSIEIMLRVLIFAKKFSIIWVKLIYVQLSNLVHRVIFLKKDMILDGLSNDFILFKFFLKKGFFILRSTIGHTAFTSSF